MDLINLVEKNMPKISACSSSASWLLVWSRLCHEEQLLVFLCIYYSHVLSSIMVLVPPVVVA